MVTVYIIDVCRLNYVQHNDAGAEWYRGCISVAWGGSAPGEWGVAAEGSGPGCLTGPGDCGSSGAALSGSSIGEL